MTLDIIAKPIFTIVNLSGTYFKQTAIITSILEIAINHFGQPYLQTRKTRQVVNNTLYFLHCVNTGWSLTYLPRNKLFFHSAIAIALGIAIAIHYCSSRWFQPGPLPAQIPGLPHVHFSREKPEEKKYDIRLLRLGINCTILALAKDSLFFIVVSVLELYVLFKQTKDKYLTITVEGTIQIKNPTTQQWVNVLCEWSYHMPDKKSGCNHNVAQLARTIASIQPGRVLERSRKLLNGVIILLLKRIEEVTYQSTIESNQLPQCNNCPLNQHEISMQVEDPTGPEKPWLDVKVKVS